MSKGSKKQYKQFAINSCEEGMMALSSLIVMLIINLNKYKEYFTEVDFLCKKYINLQDNSEKEINIPSKEYDDINDKLLYRQREILKVLADHQSSSFSYINLREYLVKRKYLVKELDSDTHKMLLEFLDIRNWSFHNPQSLLVASKEIAVKRLPKELVEMVNIEPQLNPILIDTVTHYDLPMLITLVIHANKRIEQFELILENMKADYSEMNKKITPKKYLILNGKLTEEVVYKEIPRISRFIDQSSDMAQISMAIQKSKYDGSNKSFNEWVIKKTSN